MNRNYINKIRIFNRFYTNIIGLLDTHILDSKYSLPEARIIFEIYHNPGFTASDIIELLEIDKGYLSRILKRFEKQKIISRTVSSADKRVFVLRLTKLGEKEFLKLNTNSENQLKRVFSHLSPAESQTLVQNMRSIKTLSEKSNIALDDIKIRTHLKPGDLGFIIHRHGKLYAEEFQYGISFETYVANGIYEFYKSYNPNKERVWVCEHNDQIIGFLLLMKRENNSAQLRYFYLEERYRGIGLGRKLLQLYMDFFYSCGYTSSYLWTADELETAASLYLKHGFKLTKEIESTSFGKPVKERRYDLHI
ncbi:MarR family transcriptional regulator with acetyltransferase activity [Aquimarina sp. MAR_2010_214]|uniref:bifunctional helix-turn-helix transcriptional regulator/GNAT family N-acetyltransferase n=1 Tax=Aquimarina sp. MAR_2010_214 TaxID=1250026 RepID=UPI000C7135A6|nr:helix-turn-helix domain-containing GNAT family N-acetyltransferase [Aquimarina sp. MAR_2010_214]PKV48723.1 MarR family transcriptional regulator with acetyltransferase activity [Aquimarina sp. MAR_2010_214]